MPARKAEPAEKPPPSPETTSSEATEPAATESRGGWFRFTPPNETVHVYAERAISVSPGDTVEWPEGSPADGNWTPAEKPTAPPRTDTQEQ